MDGLPSWNDTVDTLRGFQPALALRGGIPTQSYPSSRHRVLIGSIAALAAAAAIFAGYFVTERPSVETSISDASIPVQTLPESLVIPPTATFVVESAREPVRSVNLPIAAAPPSVTIFYDPNKNSADGAALGLASGLQRQGVFVRQVVAARTSGPSVSYVFEQDRQTALSLAVELGGLAGPVRQIKAKTPNAIPGTILISLQ